jgi:RNA polymerase sigma-70 factor, ECF subfamily
MENLMTSHFYPLTSQTGGPLTGQTGGIFAATSRSEPGADRRVELDDLVRRVQRGDAGGMLDLYEYILRGLRPYLARQLRPQDYRDKIHSIFVDVVVAIQQGQLREPERLMGFARTIARRKVSCYIDAAASDRRNQVEIGSLFGVASPGATPEQEMVSQEQRELVRLTLARLSEREAEILSRFYLQEQTEMQIRSEMDLTHTQYRLLKWRSKARFEQVSRKQLATRLVQGRYLQVLCANNAH